MNNRNRTENRGSYSSCPRFAIEWASTSSKAALSTDTIRCAADLKQLLERKKLRLLPKQRAQIVVELPRLLPYERERWSNILTKHSYQCGCSHGAAFLLAGVILLLVQFSVFGLRPLGFWYLVVGPLLLILLSGVGKGLGILWSRIQLRRSVNHLLANSGAESVASRGPSGVLRTLNVSLPDSERPHNG